MYGVPDEFPSWAPVFFTLAGVVGLVVGILDCFFDFQWRFLHNSRGLIFFGAVWTVAGIIWWKKQNEMPLH
jgi:uncharacterized membrane protein HdeD (DUF308 family)